MAICCALGAALAGGCARDSTEVVDMATGAVVTTGKNIAAEGPNSDQVRGGSPTPQPETAVR